MVEESLTGEEPKEENVSRSKISLNRLVKKEAVRSVFRDGQKHVSRFFVLFFLARSSGIPSYAIHVRKKYGSAVERNHAKRLLREALRHLIGTVGGAQIIIVPRREMKGLQFWSLVAVLEQVFSSLGRSNETSRKR